jgi:hypothetical protein
MSCKYGQHAADAIVHHQRIAGKGDETLLPQPVLIEARIADRNVGETWNASLRDSPDFAFADRNA